MNERKWINKEEAKEIWPNKPPVMESLEKDPYFSDTIKTPAWDRFKNAFTKVYNLDKEDE